MIPHERSLVEQYKNRPFALIGVNSDRNKEQLKKMLADDKVTWRSFWDGSTDGPISTRWNISGWPTIFLIDHKGVIRHRDIYDAEEIDKAIAELVAEAEKEQAGGK